MHIITQMCRKSIKTIDWRELPLWYCLYAICTNGAIDSPPHTHPWLLLGAISLSLCIPWTLILIHSKNCTKHTYDPHVFLTIRGDLLHISLYSPIAYQHLPRWTCIHTEGKAERVTWFILSLSPGYRSWTASPLTIPPPHYVKLWIRFGVCMNPALRGVCLYAYIYVCVTLKSAFERIAGCIQLHPCMHVCNHAETPLSLPFPLLSLSLLFSLSLHLSCIHRSISFGNEVWRRGGGVERVRGTWGGREINLDPLL